MNRVAAACAAVPGATEDIASRTLAGCEEWHSQQLVGAVFTDEPEAHDRICKAMRKHIRKTQFAGLTLWGWWQIASVVLELIRLWWSWRRNKPAGDDA